MHEKLDHTCGPGREHRFAWLEIMNRASSMISRGLFSQELGQGSIQAFKTGLTVSPAHILRGCRCEALQCEVVRIARPSPPGGARALVDYVEAGGPGLSAHRRHTLMCDAVICSIPVGCLQRSLHSLWGAPSALPAAKVAAIARTQMTRYVKVVMVYDIEKPFWHTNVDWLGFSPAWDDAGALGAMRVNLFSKPY